MGKTKTTYRHPKILLIAADERGSTHATRPHTWTKTNNTGIPFCETVEMPVMRYRAAETEPIAAQRDGDHAPTCRTCLAEVTKRLKAPKDDD